MDAGEWLAKFGIIVNQATHKIEQMTQKAVEFGKTITSGVADPEVVQHRLEVCDTCEFCKKEGDNWYCNTCGCPNWKLSELHVKTKFINLKCPKGKF